MGSCWTAYRQWPPYCLYAVTSADTTSAIDMPSLASPRKAAASRRLTRTVVKSESGFPPFSSLNTRHMVRSLTETIFASAFTFCVFFRPSGIRPCVVIMPNKGIPRESKSAGRRNQWESIAKRLAAVLDLDAGVVRHALDAARRISDRFSGGADSVSRTVSASRSKPPDVRASWSAR